LGDVEEDVAAEGWLEEKAELEDMVGALREEVERCAAEMEEVKKTFEQEKTAEVDRWKAKMDGLRKEVEPFVAKQEQEAQSSKKRADIAEARAKDVEKQLTQAVEERDAAIERAEKADRVLESGKELGGELREANERLSKVQADLRNANSQIAELEDAVIQSEARTDDLEKEIREERALTKAAEQALASEEEDLRRMNAYVAELEQDAGRAAEHIEALERQAAANREEIAGLKATENEVLDEVEKLVMDRDRIAASRDRAEELTRQLGDAIEANERKMSADDEELVQLKSKVASLERERARQRDASMVSQDPSMKDLVPGPTEAEMEALEEELDAANREVARLTTLLEQSPARKAIEKAKDMKIDMLEKEKENLLERNRALRTTVTEMGTPTKIMNMSGISPIHRQALSMSIRVPRTPGGPLRDVRLCFSNHLSC
jgi:chromosome segregation ATPase